MATEKLKKIAAEQVYADIPTAPHLSPSTSGSAGWADWAYVYSTYGNSISVTPAPTNSRIIKFNRINEKCEMFEGARYKEPLDELRIQIAIWLYGGYQYD